MRIFPTEVELIDLVKLKFNYETDIQVARFLGVTKDTVSAIRNKRTVVGEGIRFTILDKLFILDKIAFRNGENAIFGEGENGEDGQHGSHLTESNEPEQRSLLLACSPKVLLKKLRKWRHDQRQAQHDRWALAELEDGPVVSEDAELLDLYKAYKQFENDSEVANALGIKRNSISMVRHGRNRFGPLPRLRIYRDIYGRDTSKLEAALESSEALLNLIKTGSVEDPSSADVAVARDSNQDSETA